MDRQLLIRQKSSKKIQPDPEMKHCKVVPEDLKIPDMNVIFQNGNHFNLIVSSDSDLAKFGNTNKLKANYKNVEFLEHFLDKITKQEIEHVLREQGRIY